jgi:hypothetical protein
LNKSVILAAIVIRKGYSSMGYYGLNQLNEEQVSLGRGKYFYILTINQIYLIENQVKNEGRN